MEQLENNGHFNREVLFSYLGGDLIGPALIKEIISIIPSELQRLDDEIREAAGSRSIQDLSHLGHKMFGMAASTGLTKLAVLARELERDAPAMQEESLTGLIAAVLEELQYCKGLMKDYLAGLGD